MNQNQEVTTANEDVSKQNPLTPSSWVRDINLINRLILSNNVVITALSEKGGGKTTFIHLLERNLDPDIKCVIIDGNESRHKIIFSELMQDNFHGSLAKKVDFEAYSKIINSEKKHVVLCIDNAHRLDEPFLLVILRAVKNQSDSPYFHVALFAEFSIINHLMQFKSMGYEEYIYSFNLGALNEIETSTYLKLLYKQDKHFFNRLTKQQIKTYYDYTEGLISEINATYKDFSLISAKTGLKQPKKWRLSKLAVSFVVVLLGTGFLLQGINNSRVINAPPIRHLFSKIIKPQHSAILTVAPEAAILHSSVTSIPSIKPHQTNFDSLQSSIASLSWPMPIPQRFPPSQIVPVPLAFFSSKPLSYASVVPSIPKRLFHPNTSAKMSKYTIQVMASRNVLPLQKLIKQNAKLPKLFQYKIYENTSNHWYILTIGDFSNVADAHRALQRISSGLSKHKPWIRRVNSSLMNRNIG